MVTEATDANGRGPGGRFAVGNKAAAGSRQRHLQALRTAFLSCISQDDIADLVATLLASAKSGNMAAITFLLTRILGRPPAADLPDDDDNTPVKRSPLDGLTGKAFEDELQRQKDIRMARLTRLANDDPTADGVSFPP